MKEADKLKMLSEADDITRELASIVHQGGKDMLQAMFEFTKLAVKASDWNLRYSQLKSLDYELKRQGKETGWETAQREIFLIRAYELLEDEEEGRPPRWNRSGLLYTFKENQEKPS